MPPMRCVSLTISNHLGIVTNQLQIRIMTLAVAALSNYGPVAEPLIYDRVDYFTSQTDGLTARELRSTGPAAVEITALWQNLLTHLEPIDVAPQEHALT